jgi:hypothetical protein
VDELVSALERRQGRQRPDRRQTSNRSGVNVGAFFVVPGNSLIGFWNPLIRLLFVHLVPIVLVLDYLLK